MQPESTGKHGDQSPLGQGRLSSQPERGISFNNAAAMVRRIVAERHERPSLVAELACEIGAEIIEGIRKPGEDLNTVDLSNRYQTSRTPIREALMRLQEDGLVRRDGYRGTAVSRISADEARELLDLRLKLELAGCRNSASKADTDLPAVLSTITTEMEAAAIADEHCDVIELDHDFHLALFRAADLPVLEPVLSRCILHMHRLAFISGPRSRPLIVSARRHWEIVEALKTGDAETLRTAVRRHIETVWEGELESRLARAASVTAR